MEMRHVRVFLVLAEELHFGRAAARLRVAQSAVSQTLKALEEEVGAPLFLRTKRKVTLSEAGRAFSAHASAAARELERGTMAARRSGAGESGRLVLRFATMCAVTVVPRVVARFALEHPGVDLRVEPGGSSDQLEALRRGDCDLAFVSKKTEVGTLASEIVETSPLVALVSSRHPLAKKRSMSLAALGAERCMFLTERNEPSIREGWRRKFAALGLDPEVVLEVDQLETILAFVSVGFGVSVAPAFVSRLRFPGVSYVPLRPRIDGGIRVVWDPASASPVALRFLERLSHEMRRSAAPRTT